MKYTLHIILIFIIGGIQTSIAQEVLEGKVTFTTSENIYVRFENTDKINIGDTLYLKQNASLTPCMVVTQKSSSSTISRIIFDCQVEKDDLVLFRIDTPSPIHARDSVEIQIEQPENEIEKIETPIDLPSEINPLYKEKIRGRLSLASYGSLSSREDDDQHRIMLRANFNVRHINGSKFSVESYVNYRQNFLERQVEPNYQTKFLRLYNLALTYDLDSSTVISIGRKINRKMSSVGAIDGLQLEKYFGNFYAGAVIGFKPDQFKFDFNPNLLEYGFFTGHSAKTKKLNTETTVGLLEQHNSGPIDRRYAYFQHRSTINKNLSIFSSMEMDLYKIVKEVIDNSPRMTNFYVSSRYRFSRKFSLMVSYDARKRIIYYETLRTEVERLLADDEARQGVRFRFTFSPIKYFNGGIGYGRRFQNDRQNKSNNINGYLSYSKLPIIGGRLSLNYNTNESSYLTSHIFSARYSRAVIPKKLNTDIYFRKVDYSYLNSEAKVNQYYYGANFSYKLSKQLSLNLLAEMSTRSNETNHRVNTRLIKRFK